MKLPSTALSILVGALVLSLHTTKAAAAAESIPFDIASVSGAGAHGFILSWRALGADKVKVFASPSPSDAKGAHFVGGGDADGTLAIEKLPPSLRWYFILRPDQGDPLTIADRGLHLASAPNFRDVGGLRTTDGHWVRMALLYRSDQLDRLSPEDLAGLATLHLTTIYDLRTQKERQSNPDKVPPGAHDVVADVLADQNVPTTKDMMSPAALKAYAAGGPAGFADMYRHLVSSPTASQAYRQFLLGLADPKSYPAVFHCTAGKDRTGWAAAIVLTALGVPEQTIVDDYMASNRYLDAKNRAMTAMMQGHVDPARIAALQSMMTNRPEYIEAALDEARKRYGSIENYIEQGLGVDQAAIGRLRKILLVD